MSVSMSGGQMKKRLFAVALAALIPATGMLIYNEVWYRGQRSAEIHDQALSASRQAASEVERIFESVKSLISAVSVIPSVTGDDRSGCSATLIQLAGDVSQIETISMVDPDGSIICSNVPARDGTNLADRDYFQAALKTDDFVFGGYTRGRVSGIDLLPVAKSVRRDGKLRGVLVSGIKLSWFQERMEERGTLANGFVSIYDRNGIVVARTPPIPDHAGTEIPAQYLDLLARTKAGTLESTCADGVPRVIGYQPITSESPLFVAAGFSKDKAFEEVNRGTLTAATLILLSGAIAAAVAIFVGNRFITQPINHVVSVIERWSSGETSARTGIQGQRGELAEVAAAVDKLLGELDRRRLEAEEADTARAFLTREMSHRVKNTLSVVQAIARQTFGKIVPDKAIETYSMRVRALAGAHDFLLSEEWEPADIRDVVTRAIAPHHEAGDDRFRLDGPAIELPPKAVVAISLILHELSTNAAKYGALHELAGHVGISWHRIGNRIRLEWVEQNGPPVVKPEREGFGTKVVSRAFAAEYAAEVAFDYRPEGVHFAVEFTPPPEPSA
jgi:two-component sensor histidine kinase